LLFLHAVSLRRSSGIQVPWFSDCTTTQLSAVTLGERQGANLGRILVSLCTSPAEADPSVVCKPLGQVQIRLTDTATGNSGRLEPKKDLLAYGQIPGGWSKRGAVPRRQRNPVCEFEAIHFDLPVNRAANALNIHPQSPFRLQKPTEYTPISPAQTICKVNFCF
jgi:hypothetical protein